MIRGSWLLWTVCATFAACGGGMQTRAPTLRLVPAQPGYSAAVTLADITPPLHLSLFGHGPESRVAAGVRLRLRCEVFLIALGQEIVALVPCDLQSPSLALQRAIAQRLAAKGVPLSADRLFLMATHTHASPAHYFEARRYSGPFSSAIPGYDPQVVDFLADRITTAIIDAFDTLAPACLGWSSRDLTGLTFNRSYVPFLSNAPESQTASPGADPVKLALAAEQKMQAVTAAAPVEPSPALRAADQAESETGPDVAVDPLLSVLRIQRMSDASADCKDSKLIGVLAVYGMHPTGVPNTNDFYHGDIFGFAKRAAEGRLMATPDDPWRAAWAAEAAPVFAESPQVIVGIANGVEGDVSPKLAPQSFFAARQHGRKLGDAIAKLASNTAAEDSLVDELRANGHLQHLSWDLKFAGGRFDDKPEHHLCDKAEIGSSFAGGAQDGPTRLRILPEANAGFRLRKPAGCHREKVPLRAGPPSDYDFPEVAPIGLVRVADRIIATAPGELTTVAGRRVRNAINGNFAEAATRPIAVVGLTNQYLSYFATREEYAYQYYEGASTLYGPDSAAFLARHFGLLAGELANRPATSPGQGPVNEPYELHADPSPVAHRWPAEGDVDVLALAPLEVKPVQRDGVMGWELSIDSLPLTFTADRSKFRVEVMVQHDASSLLVDDDRGTGIEVREMNGETWRVRWIPDLARDDVRCGAMYQLAVRGRVELISKPFLLDCGKRP